MQQQTRKGCLNNSKNSYSMAENGEILFMRTTQKQKLKKKKKTDNSRKVKTHINNFQKNKNFKQIEDPHQEKHK